MGDLGAMQHCDSAYSEILEPWRTKDFKHCLRDDDMVCTIAEVGGMFAGYIISEKYVDTIEIWRISVDRMLLRIGLGSYLVRSVTDQLMLPKRGKPCHKLRRALADIPEDNLRAQQFFRALGFRAQLPIVYEEHESFYRLVYEQFGGRHC